MRTSRKGEREVLLSHKVSPQAINIHVTDSKVKCKLVGSLCVLAEVWNVSPKMLHTIRFVF